MKKIICLTAESDTYIRNILRKEFSSAQIAKLKNRGVVSVGNKRVRADYKVNAGDQIVCEFFEDIKRHYEPKKLDVEIIYEDDDYLILDKGIGITSIPGGKSDSIFNALAFLYSDFAARVITRLDKDTMGLVLIAKNSIAASKIKHSDIIKTYLLLAEGEVKENRIIDAPIAATGGIKRIVNDSGKKAVTSIEPLFFDGKNTMLKCVIHTGRTHQIRVHMAYIGHPVVGDTLYGHGAGEYNGGQKLICNNLTFIQPFTKSLISVNSNKKIY